MTKYITPDGDVIDTEECERAAECLCCGEMKRESVLVSLHINGELLGEVCNPCLAEGKVGIRYGENGLQVEKLERAY